MSHHEPTSTPVPDDRIHGDSLHGDAPYGDSWLRPTLTTQRADATEAVAIGAARPQPPSVRRSWLVAGLGATLLLSSGFGVLSWDSLTGGLWRNMDQHETYTQPVGALTIAGGASDIEVRGGGPAGEVRVSRHFSWGPFSSQPTPKETWTGDTLTIDAECAGVLGWCSADYVVTVPRSTDVTIDSGSGDITLTGSFGGLILDVGSGDIQTANLDAESVVGETGSGDIDLELGSAVPSVQLRTGSGDVSVGVPPGADYAVTTDTGSGDEQVSIATDPSSTNRMLVSTGSGDIDVDHR